MTTVPVIATSVGPEPLIEENTYVEFPDLAGSYLEFSPLKNSIDLCYPGEEETISKNDANELYKVKQVVQSEVEEETSLNENFEKQTLQSGQTLQFENGCKLTVSDFNKNGDKALVKLSKAGTLLGEQILVAGEKYSCESSFYEQSSLSTKYTIRGGETWQLNDSYNLTLVDVDLMGEKALINLSRNGIPVDERIVFMGDHYYYNRSETGNEKVIIDLLLDQTFRGYIDSIAQFKYIGQYSDEGTVDTNPNIILREGEEWKLENAYSLLLGDFGLDCSNCLLILKKDSVPVCRSIAEEGADYEYLRKEMDGNGVRSILNIHLSAVFYSRSIACVEFPRDYSINSDSGTVAFNRSVLIRAGEAWALGKGYALQVDEISFNKHVLFSLLKNGVLMDRAFVEAGEPYRYNRVLLSDGSLRRVLEVNVSKVFSGAVNNCVEFYPDYSLNSDSDTRALDDKIILEASKPLKLNESYELVLQGVGCEEKKAFFRLKKNDSVLDERIVTSNSRYYFNLSFEGSNREILSFYLEDVYKGPVTQLVIIKALEQNSDSGTFDESAVLPLGESSVEIRSPVYRGADLLEILNKSGGSLIIDAEDFSGFYYDLDEEVSVEAIELWKARDERTIEENGLVYTTVVRKADYAYKRHGWDSKQYPVLGFLGGMYVPVSSFPTSFSDNPLKLARLVLDTDKRYVLRTGEMLELGGDYALEAKQVDVDGEKVWLEFTKDGEFIDDEILDISNGEEGRTWEVDVDIDGEDDIVVFRVCVDQLFQGAVDSIAQLEGIWLLDYENPLSIGLYDSFGSLEVKEIGPDDLNLSNFECISLNKSSIPLAGNLNFRVAEDNDSFRFYLIDEGLSGLKEVRGEACNGTAPFEWAAQNFGAFLYDLEKDGGSEKLQVEALSGREIPASQLKYSTAVCTVPSGRDTWGSYQALWLMGEKYFAGCPAGNSMFGENATDLLSEGKLFKVLQDEKMNEILYPGFCLPLEDGYSLEILELNTNENQLDVQLEKDGLVKDRQVLEIEGDYIYKGIYAMGSEPAQFPIIAVHFGEGFEGFEGFDEGKEDGIVVEGVFQLSDKCLEVEKGNSFGKLEITLCTATGLEMENPEPVPLPEGSEIFITGNLRFRTADSETLRFYPFLEFFAGNTFGGIIEEEVDYWTISPRDPVVGDTVILEGATSPDKTVRVKTSLNMEVPVDKGIYNYEIADLEIPEGTELFGVRAKSVKDLNLRVKKESWITFSSEASTGAADISVFSVPPGIYDTIIYGQAESYTGTVTLELNTVKSLKADSEGNFTFNYNTSSLPAGDYLIKLGDSEKTVTLKENDGNSESPVNYWTISPTNPVVGDTVVLRGSCALPGTVKACVSLAKIVPVEAERYEYEFAELKIPDTPNSFSVRAEGVNDLYVRVKKLICFTLSAESSGGVATISQSHVPSWTYRINIDGSAERGKDNVTLIFNAEQAQETNSEGNFNFSYNTASLPAGDYRIKLGDSVKTVTLKEKSSPSEWNPWSTQESDAGIKITTPELQEATYCCLNNVPAPKTGAEVTTERLQGLISEWLKA